MRALISMNELVVYGYRIAQVVENNQEFLVAGPKLFWIDCPDDTIADVHFYDPSSATIKEIPAPEPISQPISQGAQDL